MPFTGTPTGIARLLERDETLPSTTLSVHLCAHLWWEPDRRDFSAVHSGVLTPRRLRTQATTYNRLARAFLPRDPAGPSVDRLRYVSFHEQSGYAEAARRLVLALDRAGVDVGYEPVQRGLDGRFYTPPPTAALEDLELRPLLNGARADTVVAHLVPEYFPHARREHPRARLVGHTVWETDQLPDHWHSLLEVPDLLLVPCRWNAEVIGASGVSTRAAVVPHVVTVPRRRMSPFWRDVPESAFVFYTIATWTARKAVWNTLRAYLQAFRRDDPVLLIVKTSQRDLTYLGPRTTDVAQQGTAAWATANVLKDYPDAAPVMLVTRELQAAELEALHTRGDCFVSLCRSEGWCIPAFDAAAYGNPIVITGFGGQLDYLDADSAFLVDYTLVPVEDPVGAHSYTPAMRWAEPSIAHGAALLRRVYEDPEPARQRARALSEHVLRAYRPERIAETFVQALAEK